MSDSPGTDSGGHFRVDVEHGASANSVVVVAGEVDVHSGPELRDRLAEVIDDGVERVTIDLTETTFLDSMALGVLIGAKKQLAATGGELELVVSNPDLLRIFEITMLDRVFEIHASRSTTVANGGRDGA